MTKDLTEVIPIERRKCHIVSYLNKVMVPLRFQAEGFDVNLSSVVNPGIPESIWVDPEKIGWIVASLIGNALRYVRHGTRSLPGGCVRLELGYSSKRRLLLINVHDDGPGISSDVLPRLFQKLPRDESDQGPVPSLSLRLAQEILAAHGGSIRVESETQGDQKGTSFYMEVPAPQE